MKQLWFVYLLRCSDGSLYCGSTTELARRVDQHQRGKGARYTRSRLPVELAYVESKVGRSAALKREAAIKRLSRKAKLLLLMGSAPSDKVEAGAKDNLIK